jgi:hypothetical protein
LTIADVSVAELRIVDAEGHPAASTWVSFFPLEGAETGRRPIGVSLDYRGGAAGQRVILSPGRYRLIVQSTWDGPGPEAIHLDGVPVAPGAPLDIPHGRTRIDIEIPSLEEVSGRVVDSRGAGVAEATLHFFAGDPAKYSGFARTDAGGHFHYAVPVLPVTAVPDHEEHDLAFEPEAATFDAQGREVVFVAHPSAARQLRGRIVAAQDGAPLQGVVVEVRPQAIEPVAGSEPWHEMLAETWRRTTSRSDGTFTLACPQRASFGLVARAEGRFADEVLRDLTAEACEREVTIEMERGARVTLRVEDGRGGPLAGLLLRIAGQSVRTDAAGRVVLEGLRAGEHAIEHVAGGSVEGRELVLLPRSRRARGSDPVRFDIGSDDDDLEIELRAVRGGALCLEITDPAGSPLPVAKLEVYRGDEAQPISIRSVGWIDERASPERLCTKRLAPGRYRLRATSRFFVPAWWSGEEEAALARAVTVEAGRTTDLGTMIARPAGTVRVTLADGDAPGAPFVDSQTAIRFELCPAGDTESAPVCGGERSSDAEASPPVWILFPVERVHPWRSEPRVRALGAVPAGRFWIRACVGEIPCDPAEAPLYLTGTAVEVEPGEAVETSASIGDRAAGAPDGLK